MKFVYVLPGWEGSAHDDQGLWDAISSLVFDQNFQKIISKDILLIIQLK